MATREVTRFYDKDGNLIEDAKQAYSAEVLTYEGDRLIKRAWYYPKELPKP